MLPLIVRPALTELIAARPDSAEFNTWVGIMFYVPAIAGGSGVLCRLGGSIV